MISKSDILVYCCNTPEKTNVSVLRGKHGDLLIDTSYGVSSGSIVRWITKNNFDIKWIILTHGHYDHSWNARYLTEKYDCKVIIHKNDLGIFLDGLYYDMKPSRKASRAASFQANKFAKFIKIPKCKVDYPLTDANTTLLRELGFDADIIMLPGHTEGSIGVLAQGVLYAGDACSAKHGKYQTQLFGMDVDKLFASERKIFQINPDYICPGHGKIIDFKNDRDVQTRIKEQLYQSSY